MLKGLFALAAFVFTALPAAATPPIEVYGRLPHIADVEISPDGRLIT
jgi:hypothetical protein